MWFCICDSQPWTFRSHLIEWVENSSNTEECWTSCWPDSPGIRSGRQPGVTPSVRDTKHSLLTHFERPQQWKPFRPSLGRKDIPQKYWKILNWSEMNRTPLNIPCFQVETCSFFRDYLLQTCLRLISICKGICFTQLQQLTARACTSSGWGPWWTSTRWDQLRSTVDFWPRYSKS